MFGRITEEGIHRAWQGLKGHLRHTYDTTRHVASHVNRAMDIGRRLYSVAAPLLEQHAVGRQIQDKATRGFSAYDKLRADVQSAHDQGALAVQNARKAVPELGL